MTAVEWDHLQIYSADPEAAALWFETHLGASIQCRADERIDVLIGGMTLFITPTQAGMKKGPPPAHPHAGLDHIGVRVEDIAAFAYRLRTAGVRFTQEPTVLRPGVKACFVEGPDGISIEILERITFNSTRP